MSYEIVIEEIEKLRRLFTLDLDDFIEEIEEKVSSIVHKLYVDTDEDFDEDDPNNGFTLEIRKTILHQFSLVPKLAHQVDLVLENFEEQIDSNTNDFCEYNS